MKDTIITVSGTVKNPNLKAGDPGYIIEKFSFGVDVPMPTDLEEALRIDKDKVWANHYLQTKIDYLNKYRTVHISKRLEALGLAKPKRAAIDPALLAVANKILAAKQTLDAETFAKVQQALKEQGIEL